TPFVSVIVALSGSGCSDCDGGGGGRGGGGGGTVASASAPSDSSEASPGGAPLSAVPPPPLLLLLLLLRGTVTAFSWRRSCGWLLVSERWLRFVCVCVVPTVTSFECSLSIVYVVPWSSVNITVTSGGPAAVRPINGTSAMRGLKRYGSLTGSNAYV